MCSLVLLILSINIERLMCSLVLRLGQSAPRDEIAQQTFGGFLAHQHIITMVKNETKEATNMIKPSQAR